MIFVFDIDDTISETDKYSTQYINNFIKTNNLPHKQICEVSRFVDAKFDWDMDTALTWYKTYGDQMMLEFPCKNNAINSINTLYDSGHTIIFATARATDWHTNPEEITKQWLKNNHIKYHKLHVGRVDKELICNEEHADVFVDDDIKIATKVSQHNPNIKTFLATTDYNKNLDIPNNITRIENIQEVLSHFKIKPFYM